MRITNNNGFTIIEIMVVLVVAAIMLSFALPQVNQAYDNYQFSDGLRSIVTAMIRAKGIAIHDGVQTSVTFTTQNGRVTYTAFVDNGDGGGIPDNGILDGNETVITTDQLYRGITLLDGNTTFRKNVNNNFFTQFNNMGFAMGAPGANVILYPGVIIFSPKAGAPITNAKVIQLDVAGTIQVRPFDSDID